MGHLVFTYKSMWPTTYFAPRGQRKLVRVSALSILPHDASDEEDAQVQRVSTPTLAGEDVAGAR